MTTTCEKCQRETSGKVYSGSRCEKCYRRDLRISRGLKVSLGIVERVLSRVTVDDDSGCHIYRGADNGNGYGRISSGGRADGRNEYAHRVMYEAARGPIPSGLHIDHLCRNRACVNPDHLEAVTQSENNRRAAVANGGSSVGVYRTNASRLNPWAASIGVAGRSIHLGLFSSREEAMRARRAAEDEYWYAATPERRAEIEAEVAKLNGAET